jgi:type II secretory pathway pseudopilin PulG
LDPNIISKIKTKIALSYSKFGKRKGSLLLELAIAVSIIGLISGFFIKKTISANRAMRLQITKNNIETVTMALASYVANERRLPRPAADKNGDENNASEQDLSNFVGHVPFNTLAIPAKTALDGEAKPLIYIVEPNLTSNFDAIYEGNLFSSSYFCYPIADPKISVSRLTNLPDIIAFAIDTADNFPNISDKITITASKNTVWVSRDMILMKYLKNPPCRAQMPPKSDDLGF